MVERVLDFPEKANGIINYIKKRILEDVDKEEFTTEEISGAIGLSEQTVRIVFGLVSKCGGFYNSAGNNSLDNWFGYDRFTIKSDEPQTLDKYLQFSNTETLLNDYVAQFERWEKERNESSSYVKRFPRRIAKRKFGIHHDLVLEDLLVDTRGYLQDIAAQASECYRQELYDASLILIRKLLEGLIIELFESRRIETEVRDSDGHYLQFSKLVGTFLSKKEFGISRTIKSSLPKIKKLADSSAHNRRFSAKKTDVDKHLDDTRMVIQELVHLINF